MTWNDLVYIAPEIVLTIGASILLVMPVVRRGGEIGDIVQSVQHAFPPGSRRRPK